MLFILLFNNKEDKPFDHYSFLVSENGEPQQSEYSPVDRTFCGVKSTLLKFIAVFYKGVLRSTYPYNDLDCFAVDASQIFQDQKTSRVPK